MLETLKNIKKDKNKEKMIYILMLLIVLFIAFSLIFNEKEETTPVSSNIKNEENKDTYFDRMENELEEIINKIKGVSNVSIMITFSNESKVTPVYNVVEEIKDGNVITNKEVVYNEEGSDKVLAIQTVEMPKIEAIVVVASGVNDINLKSQITEAVANLANVGTHKVQIFEKGE